MKSLRWILLLVLSVTTIVFWVSYYHRTPSSTVSGVETRRKAIQDEVSNRCEVAKVKRHLFSEKYPNSNELSRRNNPEKMDLDQVKVAERNCEDAKTLLDPPLPISIYEKNVQKKCVELEKKKESFDRRFPTEESQRDNDVVLQSKEWNELMSWTQACDEAKEELKEIQEKTPHSKAGT